MPPKLAKPDSTVKFDKATKPEKNGTSFVKSKLVKAKKPEENGDNSEPKAKKARIKAAGRSDSANAASVSSKSGRAYDNDDNDDDDEGETSSEERSESSEDAQSGESAISGESGQSGEEKSESGEEGESGDDGEPGGSGRPGPPSKTGGPSKNGGPSKAGGHSKTSGTKETGKNREFGESDESDDDTPQEKEDEVEEILSRGWIEGRIKFRVKWKGYSLAETTWEPLDNLRNAQELVDEFETKRKAAVAAARAEKKAGPKPVSKKPVSKKPKSQPSTSSGSSSKIPNNDRNFAISGVNSVVPSMRSWILQYDDSTLVPVSQAKVMSFPTKERVICADHLTAFIDEHEAEVKHAKEMRAELLAE